MNHLLDTCVLSELRKPAANPGLVDWARRADEPGLYLSVLSIGEIQRGIARLDDGRRKQALQHWLEHELLARFSGRILPVELEAALEWGLVGAARERAGRPAPVTDSLIAATAIVHNLVLVTRNQKDFSGYPVKVLNPWSGAGPRPGRGA